MAELGAADVVARRAAEVLRAARGDELDAQRLEAVAEHLAVLARDPWCLPRVQTVLADWRDRLGSYVLTARALIDVGISPDHVRHLLQRGLNEVVDEVPLRLAGLHAVSG